MPFASPNTTNSSILLKSSEQLCQVRHIIPVEAPASTAPTTTRSAASPSPATCSIHVILDPDGCLDQDTYDKFKLVNLELTSLNTMVQAAKLRLLSTLALPSLNSAKGRLRVRVRVNPNPNPQYNRNTLEELQEKFDELEAAVVFAKPGQVNVHVEYLHTSFPVKTPNGGSRLVTSFREVAQYSKPQLS